MGLKTPNLHGTNFMSDTSEISNVNGEGLNRITAGPVFLVPNKVYLDAPLTVTVQMKCLRRQIICLAIAGQPYANGFLCNERFK
jgi:hypothetical protein